MKIEVRSDDLILKVLPNGRWCQLCQPLRVRVYDNYIHVPDGFQTDFASVPKIFWHVIPPMGLHTVAAVVHDWLYYSRWVKKASADTVFYQLMRFYGVPLVRAKIMYLAVKWFGGRAWRLNKERKT